VCFFLFLTLNSKVQILTPGTLSDDAFLSTQDANNLFVLIEWSKDVVASGSSSGSGHSTSTAATTTTIVASEEDQLTPVEFGVCYVDCTIGTFRFAHIRDDERRMQLQVYLNVLCFVSV
jgi:DNA mismatch repair ATPase MutS